MTKQDINHIYEQSVFQIRLAVAMHLLACPGVNQETALQEADKFVDRLLTEDASWLLARY